jgi:hypothetical protein
MAIRLPAEPARELGRVWTVGAVAVLVTVLTPAAALGAYALAGGSFAGGGNTVGSLQWDDWVSAPP